MPGKNGILNYVENYFNVLRIGGCGEVPVQLLGPVLSHRVEHLHEKLLYITYVMGVSLQLKTIING